MFSAKFNNEQTYCYRTNTLDERLLSINSFPPPWQNEGKITNVKFKCNFVNGNWLISKKKIFVEVCSLDDIDE